MSKRVRHKRDASALKSTRLVFVSLHTSGSLPPSIPAGVSKYTSYISIATQKMDRPSTRINSARMPDYIGQTVRIVGKLLSVRVQDLSDEDDFLSLTGLLLNLYYYAPALRLVSLLLGSGRSGSGQKTKRLRSWRRAMEGRLRCGWRRCIPFLHNDFQAVTISCGMPRLIQ